MSYTREPGHYEYYHLLSRVDLPIKSQDDIHDFFRANQGKEFFGISSDEYNKNDLLKKQCTTIFLLNI